MNDINNSMTFGDDYAAGLTAYNKDGLELFIHNDGKVYASQSAMARMLGDNNDSRVRRFIARHFSDVTPLKIQTSQGFTRSSLYAVEVIVALVKECNPELMERFALMGANVYLYQLAGYKVNVQPTFEMSEHEKNERLLDAMTQKVAIGNYAKAHPNFQAKIDFIVANKGAIGGKMTLDEFNTAHGYVMTVGQKMAVGRGMSEVTRKETGTTPTRRNIKVYKEGVKSYTIRQVCEYDVSLTPEYISLCGQRGIG